jgi:hypothetical protein
LLIEFDAAGASEIRQRSLVMLWVSSGATLLLMAAALFLSRLLRQSQDMVRRWSGNATWPPSGRCPR